MPDGPVCGYGPDASRPTWSASIRIYRPAWPGFKTRASFAADVRHPPGALWWLERDGRRFLELALAALWRDPRLRSLRLSTAEEKLPALRLYLRMGFRRRFLLRYHEAPLRTAAARQARRGVRWAVAEPPRTSTLDKDLRFRY